MSETTIQREIRHREREICRAIGQALRQLREDASLSQRAVAAAAGIDRSFLGRLETGNRAASIGTLVAITTVLGADLGVRAFPTTGPRIHDRTQAPIVEALLRMLHRRWVGSPEVPLYHPARGVADLVVSDRPVTTVIEAEIQGQVGRLEQQLRWHREKEASLPSADLWRMVAEPGAEPATSRLLVLRSTRALREIAVRFEETLRAAYPANCSTAYASLSGASVPWPGPAILWARVEGGRATILDAPPRGVRLGRG